MSVTNRDRYPASEFIQPEEIKPWVEVDGEVYVLVGYEDGDRGTPLVARAATSNPASEDLHATPLYELLKFSQGAVREINSEGQAQ